MKISIEVDCTPEEFRRAMGWPDVAPLQELMMEKMRESMLPEMENADLDAMMKTWMSGATGVPPSFRKCFGRRPLAAARKNNIYL